MDVNCACCLMGAPSPFTTHMQVRLTTSTRPEAVRIEVWLFSFVFLGFWRTNSFSIDRAPSSNCQVWDLGRTDWVEVTWAALKAIIAECKWEKRRLPQYYSCCFKEAVSTNYWQRWDFLLPSNIKAGQELLFFSMLSERQSFIEKAGLYSTFCSFNSFNVSKINAYLSTWLWLFLSAMSFFSAKVQEFVLTANLIFFKLQ